jgi:hypothetical protein
MFIQHSPDPRPVRAQDRPFERLEQWATALVARKGRSKPPVDHAVALIGLLQLHQGAPPLSSFSHI